MAIIAWSNVFELGVKRLQEGSLDDYHIVQDRPGRFVLVEKKEAKSPWFYQVAEDDIETISVRYLDDKSVSFYKTEQRTWAFADPDGIPPNYNRWGGITLLLSGPGTRRDLTAVQPIIDDPAQYGLDAPDTIVDVGLTAEQKRSVPAGRPDYGRKAPLRAGSGIPRPVPHSVELGRCHQQARQRARRFPSGTSGAPLRTSSR